MLNFRVFPDLMLLGISIAAQLYLSFRLSRWPSIRASRGRRIAVLAASWAGAALFAAGYLMVLHGVNQHFSPWWSTWIQGWALLWAMCLTGASLVSLVSLASRGVAAMARRRRPGGVSRRVFLGRAMSAAVPAVAVGFGIVRRNDARLTETSIAIPNLPKDLDGLRIVQISDIHLSPFLSERELARLIDMANETRAHLALMTGDLITRTGDPLDACLRQLGRLRADAGVLGCLGNHEIYTGTEDYVTEAGRRMGIDFLRMRARAFSFGSAAINFAGVDYQRSTRGYLIGAEQLVAPGKINVMLSHNPDVFPVAAKQGFDLTIAGHTHGGQVNVEILDNNWNLARFFTPYTRGLYRDGGRAVFVSAGVGTVGVPIRLGAPAEINLLKLCAS